MNVLRQLLLSVLACVAAVYLWAAFVPSAWDVLGRFGVTELPGLPPPAETAAPEQARGGFGGGRAARVLVAEVAAGTIDDRVEAIGDGRALRSVTLRAEVSGRIVDLPHESGGYVEAGDVILRLDEEVEAIELERARLTLEEARDAADRLSQLGTSGTVTQVREREARLALRTAELALREAEYDLSRRVLRSPLSGWLGVLDLSVGDRISGQEVIGTVTDRSAILIDFRVPERLIGRIETGMPVTVRALGFPDESLAGEVRAIDSVVDRDSRTLRVQAKVDNRDDRLRAGMAFAVTMEFAGAALPSVDPLSVQWSSEGSFVWAVRDGKAARVPVTIRQRNADAVIVEGDLAPGEVVVTEGVQSLRPGAEVTVAEPRGAEAAQVAAPGAAKL
ncbi:MAG: efflux RND transporter periplasmic adaptor subunit [Rhodobacteraceae bacterium]|nr:efflux RND transporter periplasmic adaptor subunit [Paracoccaceae bacterium]